MGVEKRMADRCNTIRLYSFQTDVVYQVLKRDGVCYSKEEYVRKKYKESAKVFINAYGWFVKEAQHIAPKPEGAEYPYWAFTDLYNVDQTGRWACADVRRANRRSNLVRHVRLDEDYADALYR